MSQIQPGEANRELAREANAKLLLATQKEVAYWKQKANARWLESGDSNSMQQRLGTGRFQWPFLPLLLGYNQRGYAQSLPRIFLRFPIPRTYGSTLISRIPKKDIPKRFHDYRPISLSTFMSKVNTKILYTRLKPLLPKLISSNQAAFQQGKSMPDHILLALEAAHNLDRKVFGGNMIIKIDIAKAFDTLRWDYLEAILKEFSFSRQVIGLFLANLKGTMLLVLINGQPTGYFPMSRGVKQGSLANIFGIRLKPSSSESFNGKRSWAVFPFQTLLQEDGKFRIEKFDGTDFSWWKMQIEDLLVQKDLDVVLGDKREKMSDADWAGLDRKAMSVIRLSLTKNVAFNILKEKTAKGIMEALSNMYEKPSAANKVFLIRELVNTRMKEGTSVTEHINKLNSILARLLSVGIKFDDKVQALLLLSSLPDSWSGTVTAVIGSVGPDEFTFDQIRDLVLGEDVRRKSSGESSGELLYVGRGRRNSRGSGSRNRQRSQSKTRDSSGVTCWKCKEVGHFRNQCPNDKKVNIAESSASDEEVLLTCCAESSVDSWVMDSGASFHATHSSEALQNLVIRDFGKVRLADDRALEGHEVKFRDGQWKVVKGNLVMARGRKSGSLYLVELPSEGVTAPVQKRNKVRFTESRGQNKVVYAREKPRATGQTQDERAWKGSRGPVKGCSRIRQCASAVGAGRDRGRVRGRFCRD
ncbi:unnamed protein product [Cuscuta campestris]|uniref:CCHC-type domain-containing protein n=1 Tax=Cuscuta campestris TaxID=132261 RepID=A0A484KV93_9ASTE|nr:unnamed protein product [Cuscuta campestris]